ncbi:MAG: PKD domain-containing protein, partial [candidate division Zixibacteria bacterium]|nr:PKD domain-containing protein [candidate division Zixibacteria bacterium]
DWDFGDGGTSTAQNPTHSYNSAGTYTVTLTATNACGSDQEVKTNYITVTEPTIDYAMLPYSTGFESGSLDQYWFTQSSNREGRIQITTSYTPRGTYHLTMDDNTNGSQYAQNEAWLRVNLSGYSDVDLSFYWKEFSDESHTQDGVFFSDDGGTSFTKVYDLTNGTSSYSQINLDVDQLAGSNGLSLTGTFVIKFQQYDNYSLTTDGQAFDDISVTASTPAPVAAFSGTPTSGCAPLDVTFTDESTGDITSWSWDFGDGGTSTAQNPSHTYNSAGTYTVALIVTGPGGSDTETKTDYITVSAPPTAEFSGSPTSGDYPLQVDFSDQSTGNPTSWSWDFGDGGTSTSQNPSHTYNAAGTYTVALTVSNACGNDTETKTDYITVTEPPVSTVIGEVGVETRNQTGNGADWYTVNLTNSYTNPVVVMRGLTTNGGHKTHLRVRNVSGTSFEWQMEEWDYHDGNHTTEDCPYFVLEAGTHTLEDGTLIEAGTATIGTGFTTINFNQSFSSAPTLITGVASQNDAAAVITRTRNLGSSSFQIKLQEEEAADGVHANETVAWVAIGQGGGTNNGVSFEAGRTSNSVTDAWYTINFAGGVGSSPVFLCHDDTYDGGNTCGTRYRNLSGTSVEVFIEEEQSGDSEVGHITEVVSYVVWGAAGDIKAAGGMAVASLDEDAKSLKGRTMIEPAAAVPTTYALHQNFPNPFNAGTNITYAMVEGGHVRLDVYDVLGRRVRTLIDGYRPEGIHTIQFNARDKNGRELASGMYFYRLTTNHFIDAKKMMLLK